MKLDTLIGEPWADYGLIDSGWGRKFERYGNVRIVRPEPQAMWHPAKPRWLHDAEFVAASDDDGGGRWKYERELSQKGWPLEWDDLKFCAVTTPFRHLGFFPDMMPVWSFARDTLDGRAEPECLNLFGYTGVGSLALASKGARVTHVDASKKSVEAAKSNAKLAGLVDKPVRSSSTSPLESPFSRTKKPFSLKKLGIRASPARKCPSEARPSRQEANGCRVTSARSGVTFVGDVTLVFSIKYAPFCSFFGSGLNR